MRDGRWRHHGTGRLGAVDVAYLEKRGESELRSVSGSGELVRFCPVELQEELEWKRGWL